MGCKVKVKGLNRNSKKLFNLVIANDINSMNTDYRKDFPESIVTLEVLKRMMVYGFI